MNPKELAGWKAQSLQDLGRFVDAKRQVHQAVQLVGAVGRRLLPHHPWDIFGNMEWLAEQDCFAGWAVPGRFECRAGLHVPSLTLTLMSPNGHRFADFPLHGKTYQAGFEWLKSTIAGFGIKTEDLNLELPYTIPEYPTASGTPFDGSDDGALQGFANAYANAALFLEYVGSAHALWQHPRTWPEHFDFSSRRRFAKGDGHWHMGLGYSPGDDHNYPQPYWHLTCYPSDEVDKENLPELPGALRWHSDRWLGIVLLREDVVAAKGAEAQLAMVRTLADAGMAALEGVKAQSR